jgi:hypothetical protein
MARVTEKLTNSIIAGLTEPGDYPDGDGLYLQVTEGGRSWLFKYRFSGRSREMGLGSLKTFGLTDARKRAREERQKISNGIDPIEAKRARRAQAKAQKAKLVTFKQEAESYITAHCGTWTNDKHGDQWRATMATYVYPSIGAISVSDIETSHIVSVLEPIWTTKTETSAISASPSRTSSRCHETGIPRDSVTAPPITLAAVRIQVTG